MRKMTAIYLDALIDSTNSSAGGRLIDVYNLIDYKEAINSWGVRIQGEFHNLKELLEAAMKITLTRFKQVTNILK